VFIDLDTQMMIQRAMSGKADSAGDAMKLYIDVINLFVKVLIIVSNSQKKDRRNRKRGHR
jgi:FtsH-binding integral membrane protein